MRQRLLTVGAIAVFLILVVLAASARGQIVGPMGPAGPTASFTYSPSAPMPGDIITFDASGSYAPSGTIVSYTWDFGDGTIATVASLTITHSYIIDGTYTAQLTVVDTNGAQGAATAVIDVSTVIFFRVVFSGTLIPISSATVTAYVNFGPGWVTAPVGPSGFEIKYDNMTQPNLATTSAQKYRNPGFTASILDHGASNIGFDVHPSCWTVYFKFQWGPWTAYWPNDTTTVYSYKDGAVEAHSYHHGDGAYWDPTASAYVIQVEDIPHDGVSPSESHPIIVGILCPPPPQQYYLTLNTSPSGITTIPGQGWYNQGTNVTLTAPTYVNVSSSTRYRFNYWDVGGTSQGAGVNPITVTMNANHTATAHYVTQYSVIFNQTGLSADATGTIVTVNGNPENYTQLPFTFWADSGGSVTYSYSSIVSSSVSAKQFRLSSVTGASSPITVSGCKTVAGNYVTQYQVTFAQTGLDSSANGTVVTVNGSAKVYTSLPYTLWVDSGSSVTYSYSSTVSSSTGGKQFRLNTVSGHSSPFIVSGPMTVTGNYIAQYSVTFAQTGLDSTASGTIVTVNGNPQILSTLPYTFWVDNGTSVTYVYGSTITSSVSGKQFRLLSITGQPSPLTVAASTTITGNYKTQYYLTVTSLYGSPSPASGWFDSGTNITDSVTSPTAGGSGTQYVCTGWSGTGSAPASGTASSVTFTITAPSTISWTWKTQYYLTVTSPYDSPTPASGWFDSGKSINESVTSPASGGSGIQYVCTGWSGAGSVPASGSGTSVTFAISAPSTITWTWKTQYYLTVSSPYDSPSPASGWFDSGKSINASVASPVSGGSGIQYVCTGWSGTGSVPASGTASSVTFTITSPSTITWTWKTQYYLTVTSPYDSPSPVSGWFDSGTGINESVTSPVSGGSGIQYVCTGWSGTGSVPASGTASSVTFTIGSPSSITWAWKTQYYLTVTSLYGSPTPASGWFDSGKSINESVTSPVSGGSGIQYVCTGWSGSGSVPGSGTASSVSFTIAQPSGITWNWKTQYYLTVTSPHDSPSPLSGWFDSGTSINESVASPVSGGSGIQYVCTGWSGTGSVPASGTASSVTFTIGSPSSITWAWKTQYQVTFGQSGVGSDFLGTVVSVDSVNYNVSSLTVSYWWDSGSNHSFTFASPLVVGSKQYSWNSTSGLSTLQNGTLTIAASGSIVGNYLIQNQVTFAQVGVSSDFTGTVVIIDSTSYTKTQLPVSFLWSIGSNHSFAFQSPLIVGASTKQYIWTSTTGLSSLQNGSITVAAYGSIIGNYKTQYYLTVSSPYDSPTPLSGWFDSGTNVTDSVTSPVSGGSGIQYVCTGWSGAGSVPASGSGTSATFAISAPSTITWTWKTQYYLTVSSPYDSPTPGSGWFDSGTGINASVTSPTPGSSGTQYVCTGWSGSGSVPASGSGSSISFTINAASTITWTWKTQYYLTVSSPYDSPTPLSGWFDSGTNVTDSVTSPAAGGSGTQYVCTGWSGTGSVPASGAVSSVTFTITSPSTISWTWKTQYYLTVSSPYDSPTPLSGWFDSGTGINESVTSPASGGSGIQYVCTGWSGSGSVPASGSGSSISFTINAASTISWAWKTQYYLTVFSVYDSPSGQGWYDAGSTANFTVTTPVSGGAGTQYVFTAWSSSDPGGYSGSSVSQSVTMNNPITETASWKTQYYLTVSSPYDSPTPLSGWFDSGTGINESVTSPASGGSGIQYVCTGWSGTGSVPASGAASSVAFTITAPSSIVWSWKTQYYVTFDQTGLDSSASSAVVTVNASVLTYLQLPYPIWADNGSSITYSYNNVSSSNTGEQFILIGVTGLSSPITVTNSMTVVGNYKTQYEVTFNQTGVGSDFSGAIARIDGTDYNYGALPSYFWWDNGSSHTFSFYSPLVVNVSKQYSWASTSGLSTLQNDTLFISGSGGVTGNYAVESKVEITFGQTGVNTDFTGTVVTIDGVNYTVTALPLPFWWDTNSIHTFTYQSPLIVTPSAQQYVWTSTSGLSTLQNDTITATTSGNITGNYKTQYYLILTTQPSGVNSPSGAGWYDANTNATISTTAFVDIVPGCSRYRFNGWTTADMTEIADPTRSPTTVLIDEAKTVTANYVAQYVVVFKQSGVGADFTGTVVAIDTINYNFTSLPATFFWDNGTTHSFDFQSPLTVTPNAKSYLWTSTSGLSTQQSDFIVVMSCGNITGNYETQYYLTVAISPPGIATIPGQGWYNDSATVTLTAPPVSNYSFAYWLVNGVSQGAGVNPITLTMNVAQNATAQYTPIAPYTLIIVAMPGGTTNPPPGTYTYSSGTTVTVTAIPDSGYVLDHWELFSTNISSTVNPILVTMNMNHTLNAIFSPAPQPPTVTISPPDSTIDLGGSVFFTSSVSGGTAPYLYQWYLNGAPVSGATSNSWTFFPTSMGMDFVSLKVTDANNNTAYSNNAKVTALAAPVGGYSVSLAKQETFIQMACYTSLIGLFAAAIIVFKRKRK